MTIMGLSKKLYIIYLIIITNIISKIYSEKTIIQILLKQPDMPFMKNAEVWEENYQNLINQFLSERYQNKLMKHEVEVNFNFYPYLTVNEDHSS